MYTAIIFDFDGVLYDSEKHWAELENPYLRRHIREWEDADYAQLVGKSLPEVYAYLVKQYDLKISQQQYFSDYERMARKLYGNLAKPIPGLDSVAALLRAARTKVAIASSSKREWIERSMSSAPLPFDIDVVATAHDKQVKNGKPAPDVYIMAANKLGVDIKSTLAIEDSANGVAAAKSAGIYCVGLRNGDNDDQDLSAADEIFQAYSDATISRLKELLR